MRVLSFFSLTLVFSHMFSIEHNNICLIFLLKHLHYFLIVCILIPVFSKYTRLTHDYLLSFIVKCLQMASKRDYYLDKRRYKQNWC